MKKLLSIVCLTAGLTVYTSVNIKGQIFQEPGIFKFSFETETQIRWSDEKETVCMTTWCTATPGSDCTTAGSIFERCL